jgi:hypothetical protein
MAAALSVHVGSIRVYTLLLVHLLLSSDKGKRKVVPVLNYAKKAYGGVDV